MEFTAFLITFLGGLSLGANELIHLTAVGMSTQRMIRGAYLTTRRFGVTYRSDPFHDLYAKHWFTEGNNVGEHHGFKMHDAFV
jgi:hypothetical protein